MTTAVKTPVKAKANEGMKSRKRVKSAIFKKGEYKELVEDPFNLKR